MAKEPLLYYRTKEQIDAYRKRPALQKLRWLEAQMAFFYHAMPAKAKKIRDRINAGAAAAGAGRTRPARHGHR